MLSENSALFRALKAAFLSLCFVSVCLLACYVRCWRGRQRRSPADPAVPSPVRMVITAKEQMSPDTRGLANEFGNTLISPCPVGQAANRENHHSTAVPLAEGGCELGIMGLLGGVSGYCRESPLNYLEDFLSSLLCSCGPDTFQTQAHCRQRRKPKHTKPSGNVPGRAHQISDPEAQTPVPRGKTDLGGPSGDVPTGFTDLTLKHGHPRRAPAPPSLPQGKGER